MTDAQHGATEQDAQEDAENEAWADWWASATPCERHLWGAQVMEKVLRGKLEQADAERGALRQQMAAMRELLSEALRRPLPLTDSDYAYCYYCDVVGVYRNEGWIINHSLDCWVLRARVAIVASQQTP